MKFKKRIKKLISKYEHFKRRNSNTYYLSIGENCLTDNILERYKIKSFSTPYSHGRSNLDYAISLEKENYDNLLKSEHLYYDFIGEKKVVRNKHYSKSEDIYQKIHQNGFEFTHHDIISNDSQKKSYERKVLRMKSFNKRKRLKFIYHYRDNQNKDLGSIISKAEKFLSYYKDIKCELIFFTQEIITNEEERKLVKIHDSNNVKGFIFKTLEVWAGKNPELLWARKDDDLISLMIKQIR